MTKLEIQLGKQAMQMLADLAKGNGTTPAEEAEALLNMQADRVNRLAARKIEPVAKRRVRSKLGGL